MTRTALSLIAIVATSLCLAQQASADSFKNGKNWGGNNHCWRPPCYKPICPPQWWKPCPPYQPVCPPYQPPTCPPQWGGPYPTPYPTPYPQPATPQYGQNPGYGNPQNVYSNTTNVNYSPQNWSGRDASSLFN